MVTVPEKVVVMVVTAVFGATTRTTGMVTDDLVLLLQLVTAQTGWPLLLPPEWVLEEQFSTQ